MSAGKIKLVANIYRGRGHGHYGDHHDSYHGYRRHGSYHGYRHHDSYHHDGYRHGRY